MKNIWIIGAGKFGKKAAAAMSRKSKKVNITFVDKNPDSSQGIDGEAYKIVKMDGVDFIIKNLNRRDYPDWIIPVIPVHLAYEWIKGRLSKKYIIKPVPVPSGVEKLVPNPFCGKNGELYMSYANFICPDDCPEPGDICTYTKKPRLGILHQTLGQIEYDGYKSVVIKSRQLAPGIGGYSPGDLYSAMDSVADSKAPVLFSTACKCHGVMNAFEIHNKTIYG
ncbi:MAG TPA: hypothetical protein DD405_06040 [Desulfobacteraceae bacterium]|nr:hypothetical protein [Desulfobacteraceae bacterium]